MDAERARAPDLFRALELEPIPGAPQVVDEAIPDAHSEEITSPVSLEDQPTPVSGVPTAAEASPALQSPGAPPTGKFSGLADMLEPDESGEGRLPDITPPPQIVAHSPPDPEMVRSRGVPFGWAAVTLLLAGGLGYVLFTQTDIFSGDVIAKRDEAALEKAKAEKARLEAEAKANQKEYGSVQLNTTPDGARVFMLKPGPAATFENLPVAGEYLVLVDAPGHLPRTRLVKGSELEAPVVLDLDALPDPDGPPPPVPDEDVVPEPPPAGAKETGTLTVKSSTPEARLGLLVGFTPGVTVVDLDVGEPHQFLVTKTGFETEEILLRGRHFDETAEGGLIYMDTLALKEAEVVPMEVAVGDGAESGGTGGDVAATEEPPPPSPKKKKKKRKKKRKKRKR